MVDGDAEGLHGQGRGDPREEFAGSFTGGALDFALPKPGKFGGLGEGEQTDAHGDRDNVPRGRLEVPASSIYHAGMISLSAAQALICQALAARPGVALPLAEAQGCVLAEEVATSDDIPAFDRSAMDGYAVALDELSEQFRVIGEIQPGAAPELKIGAGECARVFTGAVIPTGASQVIMQEQVRREGDSIVVSERGRETHIRRRGDDARAGDVLLRENTRLHAGELALLAQLGVTRPRVRPRPRVIHFTTGNELVDPSVKPEMGEIRDSNSTLIAALLKESGAELIAQRRCGDGLRELVEVIRACGDEGWELLLISGGASVGDYDFGVRALRELGFIVHFEKVDLRPGKPLVFATRGTQGAFVIPGNPVSHFVCFYTAIRTALDRLQGSASRPPLVEVQLAAALRAQRDRRETYWPARLVWQGSGLLAHPVQWQSSGDSTGLLGVNGLLQILPGSGAMEVGTIVKCLLLDPR